MNKRLTQNVCLGTDHSRIQGMRDSKDPLLSCLLRKMILELNFTEKSLNRAENDLIGVKMKYLLLDQNLVYFRINRDGLFMKITRHWIKDYFLVPLFLKID